MPDVTPELVAGRQFPSVFRGYARGDVRAFLAEVAQQLEAFQTERTELAGRLDALTGADLEADIDRATAQINRLLQEARSIAEDMRTRAADESRELLADAHTRAEAEKLSASEDAYALRRDAWNTAAELIEQCSAYAVSTRDTAGREALQVVGEAEREAHRIHVAAKRESEDIVRAARMEAERMATAGRARQDELIEAGLRQAEAAQERTRALEQRRNELMVELERLRVLISGDAEPGQPSIQPPATPASTVTPSSVAPPGRSSDVIEQVASLVAEGESDEESEEGGVWVPGETVRVVHPASGPVSVDPPPSPPKGPEIKLISADELARRRTGDPAQHLLVETVSASEAIDETDSAEGVDVGSLADPEPQALSSIGHDEPEPESEGLTVELIANGMAAEPAPPDESTARGEPPVADVVLDEASGEEHDRGNAKSESDDPNEAAVLTEVASLFDRLRDEGRPADDTEDPTHTAGDAQVVATRRDESGEVTASEDESIPPESDVPMRVLDLDVFELRDRFLLPVANRGLRSLKRELVEEQNVALEELRVDAASWGAPADRLRERLLPQLEMVATESATAGHQAAEALVGTTLAPPGALASDPGDGFVDELCELLAQTVTESRAAGEGDRQIGAAVSRVFRVWRTDQAERRVRDLSVRMYHQALASAMRGAGHEHLAWRTAGRGCATCREHGAERRTTAVPPAHPGCNCTLSPLVAVR